MPFKNPPKKQFDDREEDHPIEWHSAFQRYFTLLEELLHGFELKDEVVPFCKFLLGQMEQGIGDVVKFSFCDS